MTTTMNPAPRSTMSRFLAWLRNVSLWKAAGILAILVVLLVTVMMLQRVKEADAEYKQAVAQIDQIQQLASSDEIYSLTREDMSWLEQEFTSLQERIDNIEELSDLPLGLTGAISAAPWVSERYVAMMVTLEVGRMMAESGQVFANVGEEALEALDENGIRYEDGQEGETWLGVLERRESDLYEALDKMDLAIEQREAIDEDKLPAGVLNRLHQIDSVVDEFSNQRELANDLPLAFTAFGAEGPTRYLALFQNPAETRPTGGFVGTVAFVELERGQILDYDFHDVYDVSRDYQRNVDSGIRPPWAISEFVRPDHLQYQDANWWADFPESAELIMEMTEQAGWGDVDSVVAVQPETISDLISITGPITVEVDGEEREINRENLLEEAERQRRLEREGEETDTDHKEVISSIGEVLLDHLSEGDREDMIDAAFLMFDALDRRDMQAFHQDQEITKFLTERNWAGRINPDPQTPSIAPVFANITGLKTSLAMQPSLELEILESERAWESEAVLTLAMEHFGAEEGDPFYEGFQRWWIDVKLPDGALVVESDPSPVSDPDASNGGAYIVNLPVSQRKEIWIRFRIPETDQLLIRRQPGLLTMHGSASLPNCEDEQQFSVTADMILDLSGNCPSVSEFSSDDS